MCSLTTDRVLLPQNVFSYYRMCSLTIERVLVLCRLNASKFPSQPCYCRKRATAHRSGKRWMCASRIARCPLQDFKKKLKKKLECVLLIMCSLTIVFCCECVLLLLCASRIARCPLQDKKKHGMCALNNVFSLTIVFCYECVLLRISYQCYFNECALV